nr:FAD:protein FMN transferase [Marinibactrum halimedae]
MVVVLPVSANHSQQTPKLPIPFEQHVLSYTSLSTQKTLHQTSGSKVAKPINFRWYVDEWPIMGTEVSARIHHDQAEEARLLLKHVREEMQRIDNTYSPYKPNSELSRVNRLASQAPQKVSDEFYALIKKALWVYERSAGAFDITYASVGHLYNYRKAEAPTDDEIKALKPAIGSVGITLNDRHQSVYFSDERIKIDLGGLAKGYAVDSAITLLAKSGIKHASVSAGGDTRLLGDYVGRPWMVGIKNPRLVGASSNNWEEQQVMKIPMINEAISTSGDYERFFIDDDTRERVHHIIDPGTGKSTNEMMSVSVIGPEGFNTDPLSTALFVLGFEKGLELIEKIPGYEAIFIRRDGQVKYSSGLVNPE